MLLRLDFDTTLEPGEQLLWSGRPSGLSLGMRPLEVVVVVGILVALGVLLLPGFEMAALEQRSKPSHPLLGGLIFGMGPLAFLGGFVGVTIGGMLLLGAADAARVRYAITDRRILSLRGLAIESVPRAEVRAAAVEGRTLVVECASKRLLFERLDDAALARSVLVLTDR